ncbi:MAG: hypothetical protein HC831_31080, partial [Chloroflexia bacterium]|nr:hypothetical protein [Chloroflexia bacterium]
MKKSFLVVITLLLGVSTSYTQHNLLGKSQKYIRSFYNLGNEFALKVDTIGQKAILLTYKTEKQYPFYTYEIDLHKDLCISYGVVSK